MPENRKKILLVDDEPLVRKLTSTTLASEEYEIFEAEGGKQALQMAGEIIPDLILLDVNMPDLSGYEISSRIREDERLADTYIIMLTGELEEEERERGFKAGANDFFSKPFSPIQLLNKIHSYLGDSEENLPRAMDIPRELAVQPLPKDYRFRTLEELKKLESEQLMLYALDLGRVYQNEIQKTLELNKAYGKLKEMEKMKDVFIALVSHELKTPLSIIKGYFYLLQEVLIKSSLEEDVSSFMDPIARATERLEELMGELLDFSRMKSGLMTFQKREIDLPGFLKLILEENKVRFDTKEINVEIKVEGEFRPIKADQEKLKEAFAHIVRNAVSFTGKGGKFTIECRDEGVGVVVIFRDTGKGIPDDKIEKIFSPFYQAADFLTREVGGMGLGLPITKHIIEDHGGTITLESEVGKGSSFTIKLPRSYQDAKEIVAELKRTYPMQVEELTKNLKATQEQLLSYAQELSNVYAREKQRSEQLEETLGAMESTYIKTIAALARSVDIKDSYASGHTDRVSFYATTIAKKYNQEFIHDRNFIYSLLLHDIGKIGVAEEIMRKVDKLTENEWQILKDHPRKSVEIFGEVEFLRPALSAVRSHHERWDGKGYPDGLKGDEIPMASRIISLADSFDAMTTNRPYRKGMSSEQARDEIIRQSGQQFDPQVVDAFLAAWDEISRFMGRCDKTIDIEEQIINME